MILEASLSSGTREGLYSKVLWKTRKKEKDKLVGSSAGQNTLKKPLSCHCPDHCSPVDGNQFLLLRIAVRCFVLPVEAAYTEPGLTRAIAFLCSQPPLPSSLPKDSWPPCQGELKFPNNTPRTQDDCHSTDTACTHPANRLARDCMEHARHGRKHAAHLHVLSLWSCSLQEILAEPVLSWDSCWDS